MRRTSRVCSGTGHGRIEQAELLKVQKRGQFPDESVRIKGAPVHYVNVLGMTDIKEIEIESGGKLFVCFIINQQSES